MSDPIPQTLLVDTDGDLDLSSGGLALTTSLAQFTAQKIDEGFQFFLAEWFLNQREGMPYFRHVIGRKPDLPLLESLFLKALRSRPGVASVLRFGVDFDRKTRTLQVDFAAKLSDGTVLATIDPFVVADTGGAS